VTRSTRRRWASVDPRHCIVVVAPRQAQVPDRPAAAGLDAVARRAHRFLDAFENLDWLVHAAFAEDVTASSRARHRRFVRCRGPPWSRSSLQCRSMRSGASARGGAVPAPAPEELRMSARSFVAL